MTVTVPVTCPDCGGKHYSCGKPRLQAPRTNTGVAV